MGNEDSNDSGAKSTDTKAIIYAIVATGMGMSRMLLNLS